jgi:filamentous hemagglutinin family protein
VSEETLPLSAGGLRSSRSRPACVRQRDKVARSLSTRPEHKHMKLRPLAVCLAAIGFASLPAIAQIAATALPGGGVVSAGSAAISQAGSTLRIDQTSAKAVIDWQRFNIGREATVQFRQPSAAAVALNRVGADGGRSIIDGHLSANGQVWLLNPGGVLFSPSARVDVGGLLATSLKLGNDDFMRGNIRFTKDGAGSIENQGTLTAADGGYIALLAPEVRNEGVISARLGTVTLVSGDELRVDFTGDRLIEIKVDQAAVNGLIENRNLVEAEGGWVLMSTDAASRLANGAINNSGIVRATTLSEHAGVIKLLGGSVNVTGTLDASAPNGGDGGFIETSGHTVKADSAARVTTLAAHGKTGNWLIDPNDYTIAASGGDITGAALSSSLATNNVTIQTATMGTGGGNGDIFVNDPVAWSSGNTLLLQAERNVTINREVTGTGSLTVQARGGSIAIDAPITAGSGMVAMSFEAGQSITINAPIDAGPAQIRVKTDGDNQLFTLSSTGSLASAYAGSDSSSIEISADRMTLDGAITATGPHAQVSLSPSNNRAVVLGVDDINAASGSGGTLGLTNAELNRISAHDTLSINYRSAVASILAVAGPINLTSTPKLHLFAWSTIDINDALTVTGRFDAMTRGTLTVSDTGMVSAGNVFYYGNDMVLAGTTTSSDTISLNSYDSTRAIRIESLPTIGVMSLTPAEIATLHALRISIDSSNSITVDAPIDTGSAAISFRAYGENLLFELSSTGSLASTNSIYIEADRMTINGAIRDANVYLFPFTDRTVILGVDDTNAASSSGGTLGLTNTELNRINARFLSVGDSKSGTGSLVVADAINLTGAPNLRLSYGNVNIDAALTVTNQIEVYTPTLSISGSGSVNAASVSYSANHMALAGTTSAPSINLVTYDSLTPIHIESSPTVGVLSLTPSEIATLHAPSGQIGIGNSSSGPLIVATSLDSSHLDAPTLSLRGGSITVDASISGASTRGGLNFQATHDVTLNAPVSTPGTFGVSTFGTLTITNTGSVNATFVGYAANNMALTGPTNSSAGNIGILALDSRAIHIESSPTPGVLSLTPAEIATLHAPAAHNINIGWRGGGPLTVDAGLDASHVDAGDLHLNGSSVVVIAPITFSTGASGLVFEAGSGGVQINAPISLTTADGLLNFVLSNGGQVRQSSAGVITARQMVATGNGGISLDNALGGNRIGTVAGNVTDTFWVG